MDCIDCGDEIGGKRLAAIEASELKTSLTAPMERRCLDCQERAHREGRARGPQISPTALLMRSEPDDNKRFREEGWPEKQITPDVVPPLEDEAA